MKRRVVWDQTLVMAAITAVMLLSMLGAVIWAWVTLAVQQWGGS